MTNRPPVTEIPGTRAAMHAGRRIWLTHLGPFACCAILLANTSWAEPPTRGPESSAKRPGLWSLAPVIRAALPPVSQSGWVKTPVDRFILAGLEAKGWEPATAVSRERLIRRAFFDLWGLPPTPEDVRAFVADERPDAFERRIDYLLASPHFGERWARYWLDVARFAETNGYERDALKANAWQYRDWVIRAFNDDLPYDRFVSEQLAGDELPDATDQTRIATGFLRVGTFDDEPNDPLKYKYEQLDDLIHATSTAFLAVTVRCARCHDHKFDPIPQDDYYAVLNFFIGGKAAEGPLLAYTDAGPQPPAVRLLQAGEPTHPGETVGPGFLSMIPALGAPRRAAGGGLQDHGPADATGPLDRGSPQPVDGARDGQPAVATSLRRRTRSHAR